MKKLRCASFFAGVGGIDIGFEQTDVFETVYANEIDSYPVRTYEMNSNIRITYVYEKCIGNSLFFLRLFEKKCQYNT